MQTATAQQNTAQMGHLAGRGLDGSKRRQAERLLGDGAEAFEAEVMAQDKPQELAQEKPAAKLRALRDRADLAKLAERVKEPKEPASEPVSARAAKTQPKPAPVAEQAAETAHPHFATGPLEATAPALPRRRGRGLWSPGVWLSGHDLVRFALSAVVVIMLGQVLSIVAAANANAATRIKDIVAVEGVRDNMLVGYGLVMGLDGTGDTLRNSAFTEQSLVAFLERLGVNTRDARLKTRNVAAVTVTATLPPFARQGSRIDVNVSAMGDAQSLQGGMLLATPLYAADGQVYVVAQGSVAVGGFVAGGDAAVVTKGVPTSAAIANGGIVEREIAFDLNQMDTLDLALRNPDVTTATRIAASINNRMGGGTATLRDPATVRVNIPQQYSDNVTMLLAQIEQLPVETDQIAKVVIDEATGTIVMGENVRVDTVAVAQGNLIVKIEETPQVSQPGAFAPPGAETVVVPRTNVAVDEEEGNQMVVLNSGATLNELVAGLNALGVGPRDLITILQTIKAAGALQADIQAR